MASDFLPRSPLLSSALALAPRWIASRLSKSPVDRAGILCWPSSALQVPSASLVSLSHRRGSRSSRGRRRRKWRAGIPRVSAVSVASTSSHGRFGVDAFRVGWVCFRSTSHSVIGSVMVGIRGGNAFVVGAGGCWICARGRRSRLPSAILPLCLCLVAGGGVVSRSTGGGCGGLHRGEPLLCFRCVLLRFCAVVVVVVFVPRFVLDSMFMAAAGSL